MEKAQYLRAQAAHCLELLERAKRADVQKALRSLAQEYDAAARAIGRNGQAPATDRQLLGDTGAYWLPVLFWWKAATCSYWQAISRSCRLMSRYLPLPGGLAARK
jgi:hypothetical protein